MSSDSFQVYFGGTFDPPHRGHFEMLATLIQDEWTEKIYLTPTSLNPLKTLAAAGATREVTPLGTASEREEWVKLWVEETARSLVATQQKVEIYLAELSAASPGPSYTVDTLTQLIAHRDPDRRKKWALVLGSDSLEHLAKWKDVANLLNQIDAVWIFGRGTEVRPLDLIPPALKSLCDWRLFTQPIADIASTSIRDDLNAGRPVDSAALLASVRSALVR